MSRLRAVTRGAALGALCAAGALALRRPRGVGVRSSRPGNARIRTFSEATSEGIIVHHKGVILDANTAFAAMLGYEIDELIRVPAWELLVAPESRELVRTNSQSGSEQPYEAILLRKDGSRLDVEVRGKTISEGGRIIRVGAVRDLTERRRFETRLREAQKMEAVGRLAGGVAHDFNNLLTIITGYAQMLVDQLAPGSDLRAQADEVLSASHRASELARQLLAFSRRQFIQPRVIDLNAVLRNVETLVHRISGEHIHVHVGLSPDLSPVKADPAQIEQVVINLVLNARDAMQNGGQLIIRTANSECPPEDVQARTGMRACVMLSVSDTGCGIDVETRSHLFEPFFTTKEKGTGLGLATTYGIIKQHGGDVSVMSEPGQGTEFRIYLPRVDAPVEPVVEPQAAQPGRGTGAILLVEDEAAVRRMLREVLAEQGYEVLEAANGREALDVAGRHAGVIELLLTDVIMPEMNGNELAERLRSVRPETKVLFISGYTDEAMRDREGSVNFLQKPFTPSALAQRVRALLG